MERKATEQGLSPAEIKNLSLGESLPVINRTAEWMKEQIQDPKVLPASAIGKALNTVLKNGMKSNYLYFL